MGQGGAWSDVMYNAHPIWITLEYALLRPVAAHTADYDVVDRNVDDLHEETNKAHDQEANSSCLCNFGELYKIQKRE